MREPAATKISSPSWACRPLNLTNDLQMDAGKSWPGDMDLLPLFLSKMSSRKMQLFPIPSALTYRPQIKMEGLKFSRVTQTV